jgi:hypothetical protein
MYRHDLTAIATLAPLLFFLSVMYCIPHTFPDISLAGSYCINWMRFFYGPISVWQYEHNLSNVYFCTPMNVTDITKLMLCSSDTLVHTNEAWRHNLESYNMNPSSPWNSRPWKRLNTIQMHLHYWIHPICCKGNNKISYNFVFTSPH